MSPRILATASCALVAAIAGAACGENDIPSSSAWHDGTTAIRGEAPLGYVSNNGDDTLSVVELSTLTEIARVPVGLVPVHLEGPHHLAIDPQGGWVYVGISNLVANAGSGPHGSHGNGTTDGYVQRFRLADLSEAGSVRVDSNLGDIVSSDDGATVITTHFDMRKALDAVSRDAPPEEGWSNLVVVDPTGMTRRGTVSVCTAPHGAALLDGGRAAAVACYGDDRIAFVDLDADPIEVVARVPVGGEPRDMVPPRYGPYSIVLAPDGRRALVGNLDSQEVRAIDIASRTMVDGWIARPGGAAFFGTFSEDGSRYYVPTQGMDGVAILDVETGDVITSRTFTEAECKAPHETAAPPTLDRIFVVCEGDHRTAGRLVALDPETLEIDDAIEVGVYPDAMRLVEEVTW